MNDNEDYLPTRYTNRKLTEKQMALLDNMELCNFDPIKAAKAVGYVDCKAAVKSVRKELMIMAEELLADQSLVAVKTLFDVLNSDKPIMNIKEKINVAQDILDRTGHAKKTIVDNTHTIKGGVFVLPAKVPLNLEGAEDADYK